MKNLRLAVSRISLAGLIMLGLALLFPAPVSAQLGNVNMLLFPGVPSGACSDLQVAKNQATGDLYTCSAGVWVKQGGGGTGTITGVTAGTALSGGGASGSVTLTNTAPVVNQVKGQCTDGGATANVPGTSPGCVNVSAWCGDFSGATCPGFVTEAEAVRAVVTNYGCTTALGGSCTIVDDLNGLQYWDESPLPTNFTGRFTVTTNGPAHQIFVDGTSTIPLPTDTTFEGMGGTSSEQIGENSAIVMCNPITDACPNGGFVTQNTSATTIGLSVTGSVMTVTLTAGTPFSTNANAINQLAPGRWVQISGASTSADNAAFLVAAGPGITNPQVFTLNIDSANQVTCAAPCGTAIATLETPLISFGTGGGNGIFHTRFGNFILDGHGVLGSEAIVNGQGEEGVGTDTSIQMYNFVVGGVRIENSGIFGGNGSIGTTNAGPYGAMAVNFNPWIVTNPAGAACSNNGVGACSGGKVPLGSPIVIGAGTLNFGVVSPSPINNPNWWGVMASGMIGAGQGTGMFERTTCSDQDKTAANAEVFPHLGASQPICVIVAGTSISFGHLHTEFVRNGVMPCPDPATSATVFETYGSVLTSGVNFNSGFVGFASGGIGFDIGQTGNGANCTDINLTGVNIGAATGTLIQDNITGHTITGSSTEKAQTYSVGHGLNPSWDSTSPAVGHGSASFTVLGSTSGSCPLTASATGGTINLCSTNATVTSAGLGTFVGGLSAGAGLVFSGASGAATTISTSTTNADLFLAPNGTGRVVGPVGSTTTCGFCFSGNLTTGISISASNILGLISNAVEVAHVTGGIAIGDAASFKWSQTGSSGGTVGVAIAAIGSGGTEGVTVAGTSTPELLLLGTGNTPASGDGCKLPAAGVTMSVSGTAVPFCTWTLPNSAQTWSWQCRGTYTTTTASDTFTVGVNPAQAPASSSRGEAMIYSTTTGTATSGGAAFTTSGGTPIFAGISVSSVTDVPFEFHGTIFGPATSGTFSLTGTLTGTSPSGTVNAGTTCILY